MRTAVGHALAHNLRRDLLSIHHPTLSSTRSGDNDGLRPPSEATARGGPVIGSSSGALAVIVPAMGRTPTTREVPPMTDRRSVLLTHQPRTGCLAGMWKIDGRPSPSETISLDLWSGFLIGVVGATREDQLTRSYESRHCQGHDQGQ